MSSVATKAAGGTLGGAGIGGACYYGYQQIKPTNLGEQLVWDGSTLLDTKTEVSKNPDKNEWTLLVKEHLEFKKSTDAKEQDKKFQDLNITDDEFKEEHISSIMSACQSLFSIQVPEDGIEGDTAFHESMKKGKDWCAYDSENLKIAKKKAAEKEKKDKEESEKAKLQVMAEAAKTAAAGKPK